jgi:predicted N-acetyltransferase YhbS
VDEVSIRLLAPGDEAVVRELATYDGPGDPEALLADPRTLMLVAFDGERPVGFVLGHELPRRHGDRAKLFVYEVDVAPSHQRRGMHPRCSPSSVGSRERAASGPASS